LFFGRPCAIARSRTVAKSGPVEGQDAVVRAQAIDKTGDLEIFGGRAIAVKKDHWRSLASFEVMQPNT
jgi:hypothetical protein